MKRRKNITVNTKRKRKRRKIKKIKRNIANIIRRKIQVNIVNILIVKEAVMMTAVPPHPPVAVAVVGKKMLHEVLSPERKLK